MLSNQYTNFFQPVMELQHKSRNGAKVRKVYDSARTPYQRLLEWDVLTAGERQALDRTHRSINPVRLKARLDSALEALWDTADRRRDHEPSVTVTFELQLLLTQHDPLTRSVFNNKVRERVPKARSRFREESNEVFQGVLLADIPPSSYYDLLLSLSHLRCSQLRAATTGTMRRQRRPILRPRRRLPHRPRRR